MSLHTEGEKKAITIRSNGKSISTRIVVFNPVIDSQLPPPNDDSIRSMAEEFSGIREERKKVHGHSRRYR